MDNRRPPARMIDRSIALPWVWLNGKLSRASDAKVSVFDRSFTLGDGVFDTLRILNTCPLQWSAHWRRFSQTAKQLGFTIPLGQRGGHEAVQKLLKKNKVAHAIARIQLSRGVGPRGYSPAHAGAPTLVISLHVAPQITGGLPEQWKLGVASLPFPRCNVSSANKTASRIFSVATKMEADRFGFDDALLLDGDSQVVEAISSNVFWVKDDAVFTPPVSLGMLPGITRVQVLKLCQKIKRPCAEKTALLEEVLTAEAVFLSVSTAGIKEVVQIGRAKLTGHPIVAELHERLERLNQQEAERFVKHQLARE